MPIQFDILGNREIERTLEGLDIELADEVAGDVQDYMLNVLRAYPPKKYVSRAQAYPNLVLRTKTGRIIRGFKSWKQFHYVMHLIASGQVPYKRTQATSKAWAIRDRGVAGYLVNSSPAAPWVYGDDTQSNHARLIGWKKVGQQVRDRYEKIQQIMAATAAKILRKRAG